MIRALVIGGSGFIGLNIVDELLRRGVHVRVTRRKSTPTMFLRRRGVELVAASLQEPDALVRAMEGCDVVYLAGAFYPRYSLDLAAALQEAVTGVRNACCAALATGVPRFVYTSSTGTLARRRSGRASDENDRLPFFPMESVYRAVKWAMEREVEAAVGRGLDAVTLLPAGCIGPWDVRVGTGALLVGVIRGDVPWWTDGYANLVDVGDVARAHVAAMGKTPERRYCLGGHGLRVEKLLHMIVRRYGGRFPREELGAEDARARADRDERLAAPRHERVPITREMVDLVTTAGPVSSARARRDLDVDLTPLDVALDRAHAWFTRFRYLPHPQLADRGLLKETST